MPNVDYRKLSAEELRGELKNRKSMFAALSHYDDRNDRLRRLAENANTTNWNSDLVGLWKPVCNEVFTTAREQRYEQNITWVADVISLLAAAYKAFKEEEEREKQKIDGMIKDVEGMLEGWK